MALRVFLFGGLMSLAACGSDDSPSEFRQAGARAAAELCVGSIIVEDSEPEWTRSEMEADIQAAWEAGATPSMFEDCGELSAIAAAMDFPMRSREGEVLADLEHCTASEIEGWVENTTGDELDIFIAYELLADDDTRLSLGEIAVSSVDPGQRAAFAGPLSDTDYASCVIEIDRFEKTAN